ncbi:MAG TPA: ABC transporter substrate-binding protein [Bacteroidota bacterium]|nr:ABC transporter substrate-binding protein [Bacteroidota bacterium]
MTHSTRLAAACAVLLALAVRAQGQVHLEYSENNESLFRQAVARYDSGLYRQAAVGFSRCIAEFPSGHRITGAYVMKGKALYRLGENLDAATTLKTFLSRFPSSSYVPDAELTLGRIYARIERPEEAMEMLLSAYRAQTPRSPPRLGRQIEAAMDSTIDTRLGPAPLRRLLSAAPSAPERAYLWLKVAQKEASLGNALGAAVALDSLAGRYPGNPFAEKCADLRARITARSNVKLGILLPLMKKGEASQAREVGTEVNEGVQFALEKFSREPGRRINVTLETRDTERDPSVAAAGARELAGDSAVIGILGPVFSPEVTSAAAVANARGIPLVTPTANANGIAATGRYVFQANPDYDTRGRAMARYAVQQRGFRTLAVLAPSDTYARFLAEAFIREASRLGARLLDVQWYQRGTSDLKPQLAAIRRAGMLEGADAKLSFTGKVKPSTLMKYADLGVPLKRIDSLMNKSSVISARQLLGPRARALLDSMEIPVVYDESRVDSLEYPVETVDAIYAPISGADEIGIVSSQIVYFHFQTQVLGSGEWNSFAELNANRRYADGVVFESDTYVDTAGGGYAPFEAGYESQFRKKPTKNTLFGYDTADMMLRLIGGGAVTREALEAGLAGLREFRGIHSRITLSSDRVNSALTVLRYEQDEIRAVAEVNAARGEEGGGREGGTGR